MCDVPPNIESFALQCRSCGTIIEAVWFDEFVDQMIEHIEECDGHTTKEERMIRAYDKNREVIWD